MFVIVYILKGLATIVDIGLMLLYWLLFARVILSWVNPDPFNPLVQFLRRMTDPVLEPFRRIFLPLTMRIHVDISPIFVFFAIVFLRRSLVGIIYYVAYMLSG
ncbi:MAG: YggT family protein [Candidatus Omnitrophica bacterium]|nr:YggT family protein [Candidatus Omnitrophota bacterium]MBU4479390.1 YggT family protein [Candidatus Omnitrophota bacterium]MCG2703228.1 YggT family protein [Candidatus Omnitrophota bacterium]